MLSFILRDGFSAEDEWYQEEGKNRYPEQMELASSIVAAITAALIAYGLHNKYVIKAIRPLGATNPWKLAGIMDLMAGRELFR